MAGLERSPASKSVIPITDALKKGEPPLAILPKQVAGTTLQSMQSALRQMKKSYPDAKATQEALGIGDRYGITVK